MKSTIFSEDCLETFNTVARLASFSEAADALGITTSAVSYSIKRIESALGVKLIERSTRKVQLTKAGEYFYQKSEYILSEYRNVTRGVVSIDQQIEAKIRICINNLLHSPTHTAKLIQLLKHRFPTCELNVFTEVYSGVWDALIRDQADIAIGAPEPLINGGGINYRELDYIHWNFCVSKDHPLLTQSQPISDSILRQYSSVFVDDTADHIVKRVGWLLHGQEPLYVPDLETKLLVQKNGAGIGFLPDYLAAPAIEEGSLIKLDVQNPRQPSQMLLAWRSSRKGKVIQWINSAFLKNGPLTKLYKNLMH